uniref:Alpha-soluble NSF attachment protein n=1 Tax=Globodera pallida TaxID=36090 RepID=A0A183BN77_GLOPA
MTDPNEHKAKMLMEEAEKKLKKSGGLFSFLTGGSGGPSDAAELFIKAANVFKLSKNWNGAGGAFLKAAQVYDRGDSKHDAAMNFGEAGNCFRKVDLQKAVDCFQKNADVYLDMGRFNMAAKAHTTIAELYEEQKCKEKAVDQYQKAADMYKGEEQRSSAAKCLIKVAHYAADLEQYQRAQLTFEEVAIYEADNPMLKYSAKTHFFQAILCSLCIDLLDSQRAIKRYEELSSQFAESRENQLCKQLMQAMEMGDPDGFTEAVQQFDKVSRLDQWHVAMLVKVKRRCGDGGDVKNDGDVEEDDDDLR